MKRLLSAWNCRAQYSYNIAEYTFGAVCCTCAIDSFTVFVNIVDWALRPAHGLHMVLSPLHLSKVLVSIYFTPTTAT